MKVRRELSWGDGVYEARYGWNRQVAAVIGGCLAFCLAAVVVPMPLWLRILVIGFFGAGGLLMAGLSLSRRPALRADASGVTTYPRPLSPRSRRFYPWEDVAVILVWRFRWIKSVGVICRDGAVPELARPLRPFSRAALAMAAPGIPAEAAAGSVSAGGWVLRTSQLAAAVARFAPHVRVIDTTAGQPGWRTAPRWTVAGRRSISLGQVLWACGVVIAVAFMYLGGSHLGPAIRAARGEGIHGRWVAQQCAGGSGCTWYGKFVLPDGTVVLPRVSFGGSLTSVHAGSVVPALDAGASGEVYPVSGSGRWIHDVIGLAGGAVALMLLFGRWAVVRRRRRRARREYAVGSPAP